MKFIQIFILSLVLTIIIFGSLSLFFQNSNMDSQNLNTTKTYSDGSISFNYTGKFNKTKSYTEDNGWVITELNGENGIIQIKKNLLIKDLHVALREEVNQINSTGDEVLSRSTETNPNGIKIFKIMAKSYRSMGPTTYFTDLYFKDKNKVVYDIKIFKFNENNSKTADEIFNTLKLN